MIFCDVYVVKNAFLLNDEEYHQGLKRLPLIMYFCTKVNNLKLLFYSSESTADPKGKMYVSASTERTEMNFFRKSYLALYVTVEDILIQICKCCMFLWNFA